MNIRKPVDYSAMFAKLDTLMAADLPQMELYCEIGRLINNREEKGAAVAAAEYLHSTYPSVSGFSPRNLRRMREFYRTYADNPKVLAQAMTIGWTQNVVILEAELSMQERAWYIRAAGQFGWSKLQLTKMIRECAHEIIALNTSTDPCDQGRSENIANGEKEASRESRQDRPNAKVRQVFQMRGPCKAHPQSLFLSLLSVIRNSRSNSAYIMESCYDNRPPPNIIHAKRNVPSVRFRIQDRRMILQAMHRCCDCPLLFLGMDTGALRCYNSDRSSPVENRPLGEAIEEGTS